MMAMGNNDIDVDGEGDGATGNEGDDDGDGATGDDGDGDGAMGSGAMGYNDDDDNGYARRRWRRQWRDGQRCNGIR